MLYNGVVFDFNGTLFWDTWLHNKAWDIFLEKYNLHLTEEELFRKIHGKNNRDILLSLFNNNLDDEQINQFALDKEMLYQELCLKTHMQLAPGVESFLNFLKENTIPFTIATASGKENLDFYFDKLSLDEWFKYEDVVYNNGNVKSKPHPEIYELAMKVINRKPEEVVVFEDANMGLLAAKNAKAGKIIVVNSNNDDYSDWKNNQIITNYDQVNRSLFK